MKDKLKSRLIFLGSIFLLLAAFAYWYNTTYSMEKAKGYSLNANNLSKKIAVVTQGSPFKDAIVTNIVNHYKKDSVFIKVADVSKLTTLSIDEYNVIVILHTWEYGNPPKAVSEFIEAHRPEKGKMIVMATSGAGTNKIE